MVISEPTAACMPLDLPPPDLLIFNAQPGATLLLSPEWVILGASDDYLAATLTERATIVGQYIFDAFPDNPDLPEADGVAKVRASLETVLATKAPHDMAPQHYDVPDPDHPGRFVERHWKPRHTPVLDATGQVQFIIQSVQDITASRLAQQQLRESEAREQQARAEAEQQRHRFREVLMQLPAYVAAYHGPDHIYQFVNPPYQRLFPHRTFEGRPFRDATPEAAGLGVVALFDQVYRTGEPHYAHALEGWFDFHGTGEPEQVFLNLSLHPLRNDQGEVDGVLDFSYDVTEQVRARQQLQQLNQELEARVQARTQEVEAARAELEEQRNRLLRLFSQAPAHINLFSGPDHRWTLVHPASRAMLLNRPLDGLPHRQALPELPEENHAPFDQVFRTGAPVHAVETLRRLDRDNNGELHDAYFDLTYQPLFDAAGQIEGVMSFAVNVTERVQARQRAAALQAEVLAAAHRQAQEREAFHQVFEQTPAVVALLRAPGHRYEYVNPAYQAIFPGRQLVGLDVAVAAPELVAQGFVALLDEVYRTGETYFGQELSFTPPPAPGQPARPRYFNFTYQAYREAGAIAGVSIFAYDVTEQVEARQQREAEQQRRLNLFQEAPAGICILAGPDLVFEFVNPRYQQLLPEREVLGRPFLEVVPELAGSNIDLMLRKVYATGQTHEEQDISVPLASAQDGALEDRYFTFVCQPRQNEQAAVDGILVFVFEVTEQVRARQRVQTMAEELTASNEQLTRTNVDLDNFIYTASHDLKAPISNIEGLLYLLQEELPPAVAQGETVAPTLTRMLDAVERFTRTIGHLTEVSKLQKEHTPAAAAVNLAAVVEDVRQDLRPLLDETGAQLDITVAATPPVQFAEKNLRSVVYNLLSNALKYRAPDRLPRVEVQAHVRAGHTVLEVRDNGLGIAPEHLPKLFTMFQRFHDHVEGTGIGLYMVKRMVDNAGGRIEVRSQLGTGTTFLVFLPHTTSAASAPAFPAYIPA